MYGCQFMNHVLSIMSWFDEWLGSVQHISECTLTLITEYTATTRDADFCLIGAAQTGFHNATNMRHFCSISQTVYRFTADTSKAGKGTVSEFPTIVAACSKEEQL